MVANVIKSNEIFFIKLLARKKKVCIFALGFERTNYIDNSTRFLKIQSNEQKNVSTIEKKKKK